MVPSFLRARAAPSGSTRERRPTVPELAAAVALTVVVAACGPASEWDTSSAGGAIPQRVVSLDFCADQYVLQLLDRERILAVSPDATEPYSYLRERAVGLPTVRPVAEDVLMLAPDLVVRSYGGGPNASAFFERAGIRVLNVGWASDIEAVMDVVETVAAGLGEHERGRRIAARMRERLAALAPTTPGATAMYLAPAGVTAGPGTLIHEMIRAAGLENFQQEPGWRPLPLERLVREQPDQVAAGFFDVRAPRPDAWSASRHPIARRQLEERPVVPLEAAWTVCGGWFLVDAVEALARGPDRAAGPAPAWSGAP